MEETKQTPPIIKNDYYHFSIKKRFLHIALILLILIILFGGGMYIYNSKQTTQQTPTISPQPTQQSFNPSISPATTTKPNGNAITGTVTAISDNSITIQTLKRGAWTITIDQATIITGKKGVTLQESQIQINDKLRVSGTPDKATKTVAATTIKDEGASVQQVTPTPTLK